MKKTDYVTEEELHALLASKDSDSKEEAQAQPSDSLRPTALEAEVLQLRETVEAMNRRIEKLERLVGGGLTERSDGAAASPASEPSAAQAADAPSAEPTREQLAAPAADEWRAMAARSHRHSQGRRKKGSLWRNLFHIIP